MNNVINLEDWKKKKNEDIITHIDVSEEISSDLWAELLNQVVDYRKSHSYCQHLNLEILNNEN